ncbi:hypothetical protein EKO27_g6376 [Xylaria grammica]|uniref:Uncharacterized protein n=1 Tax=Xylaria grammica TaxID=363999 RepID=A0A439D2R8_9PEZI|nr:hypothetical protein EKO27_g6376 [Xylaria grammica]
MDIAGNALVIGGGGGIGRACAILFAKEGARAVAIADLNLQAASDTLAECQAMTKGKGFKGKALKIDITRESSVCEVFSDVSQTLGRIDYCVNCAGIGVQEAADIVSLSMPEFQRFLDVNATEAQVVSRNYPSRGETRGCIVNLGSGSSLVATAGVLPYTASKHAALGLSKNSALDNAAYGIRVNCVCPSWTNTPMVQKAIEGVKGLEEFINRAVPMGRIAVPDEVADAVIFLCSPRSSYITGCGLIIDGGTTLTALR